MCTRIWITVSAISRVSASVVGRVGCVGSMHAMFHGFLRPTSKPILYSGCAAAAVAAVAFMWVCVCVCVCVVINVGLLKNLSAEGVLYSKCSRTSVNVFARAVKTSSPYRGACVCVCVYFECLWHIYERFGYGSHPFAIHPSNGVRSTNWISYRVAWNVCTRNQLSMRLVSSRRSCRRNLMTSGDGDRTAVLFSSNSHQSIVRTAEARLHGSVRFGCMRACFFVRECTAKALAIIYVIIVYQPHASNRYNASTVDRRKRTTGANVSPFRNKRESFPRVIRYDIRENIRKHYKVYVVYCAMRQRFSCADCRLRTRLGHTIPWRVVVIVQPSFRLAGRKPLKL